MKVIYDKQDDTYAKIIINGDEVGWIENHRRTKEYIIVLFADTKQKYKVPYSNKGQVKEAILYWWNWKRYQIYSEVRLENRGFTIKG